MTEESGKEVDEAAVLYLWTVGKGVVAVTTSKNPKNIIKMAETEGMRDLTKEEIKEIEEAGRKVHYRRYVGATEALIGVPSRAHVHRLGTCPKISPLQTFQRTSKFRKVLVEHIRLDW